MNVRWMTQVNGKFVLAAKETQSDAHANRSTGVSLLLSELSCVFTPNLLEALLK